MADADTTGRTSGRLRRVAALAVALLAMSGYGQLVGRAPVHGSDAAPADGPRSRLTDDAMVDGDPAPRQATAAPGPRSAPVPGNDERSAGEPPAPVAPPVAIRIPEIAVDADIIDLGLTGAGELQVPRDPWTTGWWTGGAMPGEPGSSVIVGHVDSYEGPAVFYALRDLAPGDQIHVDRADGSTVTWEVTAVEYHDKDAFPTARVYSHTREPTLKVVTCGGTFDPSSGHYLGNFVVFAELASVDDVS